MVLRDRRHRGYTLTELVVSLGLALLILGPFVGIWIGASRAERTLQERLDLYRVTSEVMSRVTRDVLASGGVATVTIPGTSDSRVGLVARGGKAIYYGLDAEGKKLERHVHDLMKGEDAEVTEVSSLPATVVLREGEGGAVRIRVWLSEDLVMTTALRPRGW